MEEQKYVKKTLNPLPRIINSIFVESAEKTRRLSICGSCDYIRSFAGQKTCGICGCFLEAKASLKVEHCPANQPKW